ncbi:MAG: acetoin:2,6-dichlorophenolindophenol oxidoreductase subunit alpha [Solirubrobacteraceae bacterium]|nr:acetoin:2,6-dichlorophenolindophenol oxidoreductase subunit alpha [Solirubrobacteraceae bacterium]
MSAGSSSATRLDGTRLELALALHEQMVRIRRFEERVAELFAAGELPGFVHLSIGQESVAVGVIDLLRESDYITATHRGHGHIIAKGARFHPMIAELMGRATGYCRGKGGSMHIFDVGLGVLGANGILGAGQPIAVGAAFSARLQGRDDVAVTFFGEGASAQGAVHEAMNLAAVWRAPVVFVAEVNGFAELTPYEVHVPIPSLAARGAAYGIPATVVDGLDVLAVRDAAEGCIARAREGGGPSLLEVRTLRWHGHYEGDPQRYREPAELARRADVDPIAHLVLALREAGVPDDRIAGAAERADADLDVAVATARADPLPAPEDALDHVYATPIEPRR